MKPKLPAIHFPVALIILLSLISSCTQDPANYDSLDPVCFDTQVLPLLQTSCGISGCHDGTEGGFLSADYNSIMESVKPNDPRGSKLYRIITDINNDDMMPPDQPLTRLQRNIIQVWIGQGAQETICSIEMVGNPVAQIEN
jgi:hypothetical protein